MSSVIVRSSLEKPFGKLANDATISFTVGNRTYLSVVNYVYANLLPESTFKEELVQMSPKNVLKTFFESREHVKKSTIQSSVHKGISEKFKQDENFAKNLMNTETSKLIYYSPNSFLGIGKDKNGLNIYGQALEQVRNEAMVEQNRMLEKDNVYLSYIAEINLKKALRKHDLEKYISKDKHRSVKRLVDAMVHDYGKTEVYANAPDVETIMLMHEKRNVVNYTDPNSLIRVVRKNEIRNVLKLNMFTLRVEALRIFVDYAISKNATLFEDKTALKDQLFDILPSKRDEFANRILDLYSVKALPEEVRNQIKKVRNTWYFPSEKDIEFFETENVRLPNIKTDVGPPNTLYVYVENDPLSPLFEQPIVIKNMRFNTISHYIAFELNKLFGKIDPARLYTRLKDVRIVDLDKFNKMFEQDTFNTNKNELLEKAIGFKLRDNLIKNLIFVVQDIQFEDTFDLDNTEDLYRKYKDKIVLKIHKIPSFVKFVEKDPFLKHIIQDKIDFYFMILDNLMVHLKAKNRLNVSYDEIVEMSPFYSGGMMRNASVTSARMPEYLVEKNKPYGLNTRSLMQIWSIVFNGLQESESVIFDEKERNETFDIRYKSLFIWAKYLLGKPYRGRTLDVMQSRQEDIVLFAIIAILSKLREVNVRFESPTINGQDLQTAVHLCLGKVREYNRTEEYVAADIDVQFDDEVNPDDVEVYDEEYEENYALNDDFEGFNLSDRKRVEALLSTLFNPLKSELQLSNLEDAVYKVLNSKLQPTLKHQIMNFFLVGFQLSIN
jgi:predicted NAD-dependent protein-ADP-ribosyltransferase YbiA (DUF1768 family)